MIVDGHIHTPYCPHGTTDTFEQYIAKAISLGFKEITFTEHAPLPFSFIDTTPTKDSSMQMEKTYQYLETIANLKKKYSSEIKINRGFEVDYIEGFEKETSSLLAEFGPNLDDSILSVHFLKKDGQYFCLDYSPEYFQEIIDIFGGIEEVYKTYFQTVLKSIQSNLGIYKPKRIGHLTLVHKFQKKYPAIRSFDQEIREILQEIKSNDLQIDYNGAGINKPYCQETYPPQWVIKEAMDLNIKLVYGSDAHQAKDLGQGLNVIDPQTRFFSPTT